MADDDPGLLDKLPPWPDELLHADKLPEAIAFASTLAAPPERRTYWLHRWARYTGVQLDASALEAVRRGGFRPGG